MEAKTLISLIIMVVVISLILTTQTRLFSEAEGSYTESACRSSVLLRGAAQFDTPVKDFDELTPLACSAEDLGVLGETKNETRKKISDYAATCWWMFAEGQINNVFAEDSGEKGCHICYRFRPGTEGNISGQSILEYMQNNTYNPSVLKGGGTHHFIGDGIELSQYQAPPNQSTINLAEVDAPSITDFVNDATGYISNDTETEISKAIQDIIEETGVTGYVVVAHDIKNHNRGAAQQAMEQLKLTKQGNHTKGFLLTVSLSDRTIRLDAGRDLTNYFSEVTIVDLLQPMKTLQDPKNVENRLRGVVQNINDTILSEEEKVYDPSSYFGYFSNGRSFPLIAGNLSPKRTYAVAYVAPSSYVGWMKSAWTGMTMTYFATKTGVAFRSQSAFSNTVSLALEGYSGGIERKPINNIMIAPNNEVAHMCDD